MTVDWTNYVSWYARKHALLILVPERWCTYDGHPKPNDTCRIIRKMPPSMLVAFQRRNKQTKAMPGSLGPTLRKLYARPYPLYK